MGLCMRVLRRVWPTEAGQGQVSRSARRQFGRGLLQHVEQTIQFVAIYTVHRDRAAPGAAPPVRADALDIERRADQQRAHGLHRFMGRLAILVCKRQAFGLGQARPGLQRQLAAHKLDGAQRFGHHLPVLIQTGMPAQQEQSLGPLRRFAQPLHERVGQPRRGKISMALSGRAAVVRRRAEADARTEQPVEPA